MPEPPTTRSAWRPYRFPNLEKLTRAQCRLPERMELLLPPQLVGSQLASAIAAKLKDLFEEQVRLVPDLVHVLPPSAIKKYVSNPTCLAVLAPAPPKMRGLLEVELSLAHAAVDLLLGGAGEPVGNRPLSEIEEGVLGFALLEALKALGPNLEPGLPRICLEGMFKSAEQAEGLLAGEQAVVMLQLKAAIGEHAGLIRAYVPSSLLSMAAPPKDGASRRARRMALMKAHPTRLAGVRFPGRVEIGRVEISALDLAGLRLKDVVLLDEITARPDKGKGGKGRMRIGMGQLGRLDLDIALDGGRFKAKVTNIFFGEEQRPKKDPTAMPLEARAHVKAAASRAEARPPLPFDEEFTDPGRNDVEDVKNDPSDLLSDIPLQISIELARLAITAEDLLSLKLGQVIELNKTPGEPLDLSVNGKVVARGELVEVEGQLGIRILTLSG
jgi:flagellar motor switch protein FliM